MPVFLCAAKIGYYKSLKAMLPLEASIGSQKLRGAQGIPFSKVNSFMSVFSEFKNRFFLLLNYL
jgi:hypothetical protein